MKRVGKTVYGTPVYTARVPRDLLIGCGRAHNPPPRGALCDYLIRKIGKGVVVVVKVENRFTRIFKIDTDGLLWPCTVQSIALADRRRMIDEGIIGAKHGRRTR